jgi:uncharacterized protein (TIGR03435 family)
MRFAKFALYFAPVLLVAQPAFEAASVKPADPSANGFSTRTSRGQIELRNCSLRQCVETAYGLREYALVAPAWLDSVHFDVVAKLPSGASPSQFGPMLQTLLAERFALQVHRESRDVPGYSLTVAKGGPKLHPSDPGAMGSGTSFGATMVRCKATPMETFVDQLSRSLGRPVADETSLAGTFDFDLHWAPDDSPTGASLFAAIQEQLGLKLQAGKVPVAIVVVDSVNRAPTGN